MSGMVICIILVLLNVNLSVAEFYITTPTNVSQGNILFSFNTDSLPACFQKCKETPCCKDIATVKDKDKKSFKCYLLKSHETNDDAGESLLEVKLTRSITVSLLTFYVLILREFKEKFHIFQRCNSRTTILRVREISKCIYQKNSIVDV